MFFVSMLRALRAWFRYRRNVRALSQLDSHLLRDIGLTRCGVAYAAKNEI
jgi:uncharacterized protein YjiS (DUF1127 family)